MEIGLLRKHFLQHRKHTCSSVFVELAQAFDKADFVHGADLVEHDLPFIYAER